VLLFEELRFKLEDLAIAKVAWVRFGLSSGFSGADHLGTPRNSHGRPFTRLTRVPEPIRKSKAASAACDLARQVVEGPRCSGL